ncbi:insulinase family protein [Petrocella sp. FN5]|uniref:insulinase family protein n=1 Tax=Petrocella sp. FN5 TaxID=3032002 RepID=UPI0023DB36C4|nr:insulinase family protein [Petrocella sp. FN5]MDF1617064.1 insulinase family protein [Petrocella sp. FN5]
MEYKHYKIIKEEKIEALNGLGLLLEHEKSGARIMVVKNDDENKTFNIIFRTPPKDDTGLPHILEHSVLCGSRKYPVKDPFVELAKGSLNTFLNAMTYPDKTMYPVASCNNQDFRNLVDVYMDAVLYPNIYKDPRILQQEGWHYELEAIEGDVTYNGVVYNEMKGASSNPEQVLFRQIQTALFPNHPYGYDSGGEPDAITDLTQEQFLDFHRTYYHPSNSYIFFYGDLDVTEQLSWLNEAYLNDFEKIEVDSELVKVEPFKTRNHVTKSYAVGQDANTDKRSYLSYNVAFDKPESHCENLGLEVMEHLLIDAPGAPLKEALLKLNIAEDIFGSYDSGLRQPTFSIIAKNTNVEHEALFVATIESVLGKIAREGFSRKKVEAAINYFEFKVREADFGQYPKGVIYSIKALDTWLYDGDPFVNFAYDEAFEQLRQGVKNGCFTGLISTYLLNNPHTALLRLVPDAQMLANKEKQLKDKLHAFGSSLTHEDKLALIEETQSLKKHQAEPNSREDLEKIPLLDLSDIKKEASPIEYEVIKEENQEWVLHKTFTNNIVYMRLLFDFSPLTFEELPYVSLLTKLLMRMDTQQHTYSDLSDEINIHTGGINADTNVYGMNNEPDTCQTKFEMKFKCLSEKMEETLALVKEVLTESVFTDLNRLKDLILENKSRLSTSLTSGGHTVSINRCSSYFNISAFYKEALDGITYYEFLDKLVSENQYEEVARKLEVILNKITHRENLHILVNTEERLVAPVKEKLQELITVFPQKAITYEATLPITFEVLNEGFKTASKVQYCALAGDYVKEGYLYNGHMKVLQTIMSLDYMWKEVRVKGGAYGGFAGFRRNGLFFLGSYRDPNLNKTYAIYRALPDYIKNLNLDKRELVKYIIGTMSNVDVPLTPQMKGERALGLYLANVTVEDEQRERDEILTTTLEDLRALGQLIEKVIRQDYYCVIGNENTVEEEKDMFVTLKTLN